MSERWEKEEGKENKKSWVRKRDAIKREIYTRGNDEGRKEERKGRKEGMRN